jgi:hypothetical protein
VSVFLRSLTTGVTLTLLLVSTGCGGRADEPLATEQATETQSRSGQGDLDLVPATYREGDRVVLPITFPDGTSAELIYPPELEIADLGVFPYSSGRLPRERPTHEYGEVVGRDFLIRYGDLEHVLAALNSGTPPRMISRYRGADGADVGLWDLDTNDTVHYLGFQFGRWAVLVYDYVAGGAAMTDAERASWAANFTGRETDDGFPVLEGSGPLRLARAGEGAGPELDFSATGPERGLGLYPGECRPHRDQTRLVSGKLVQWSGGIADWCLSDSMRIHASGTREFIGALIRELEARNVTVAKP